MQGDVVCNASPLIFLAKIKRLDLLAIYSFLVPSHVETEILKGLKKKRDDAVLIIDYLHQRNIKPAKTSLLKDLPNFLVLRINYSAHASGRCREKTIIC